MLAPNGYVISINASDYTNWLPTTTSLSGRFPSISQDYIAIKVGRPTARCASNSSHRLRCTPDSFEPAAPLTRTSAAIRPTRRDDTPQTDHPLTR